MKIKGFTLIELLVVMGIIGILASVLFLLIDPATQARKARDAQRKSDLRQIQSALEIYRSDVGTYPASNQIACGAALEADVDGSTNTYMQKIPCDAAGGSYIYSFTDPIYSLTTCLEYPNDPQKDSSKNSSCSVASYTVNSP